MSETAALGQPLRRYLSIHSTNDAAAEWARAGAPHGAAVRADEQTQGRGRQGRAWNSPAGLGLYLSLILRPEIELARVPQLTMLAALAAARAVEELTGLSCNVKWPNDVVLRGGKIGGVLSEAGESETPYAVIGIGLNINFARRDLPPGAKIAATSLLIETGRRWEIDEVSAAWLRTMDGCLRRYGEGGWNDLRVEWMQRDILTGQRLVVENSTVEEPAAESSTLRGIAAGVDESGALRLQTPNGPRLVVAGDVRLEM